ncbi:MAG: hypothetical protein GNW80_13845 [Asgard group archaeon]|nr:hypothetical protein [Asgard group archaeon]
MSKITNEIVMKNHIEKLGIEKEMKKYFLENERVRYRFFYYFVKKE